MEHVSDMPRDVSNSLFKAYLLDIWAYKVFGYLGCIPLVLIVFYGLLDLLSVRLVLWSFSLVGILAIKGLGLG